MADWFSILIALDNTISYPGWSKLIEVAVELSVLHVLHDYVEGQGQSTDSQQVDDVSVFQRHHHLHLLLKIKQCRDLYTWTEKCIRDIRNPHGQKSLQNGVSPKMCDQ